MKRESRYTLQRTMIIYFLLIGFASLLVGIEFVAETNRGELREALVANFEKASRHEIETAAIFEPIDHLRNKAVLMIAIIMSVMVIVLTMFIKNITEPLQHMIEVSQKISTGDLSRSVAIHTGNELAELGTVINEMSSNLQEIILLSRHLCTAGHGFVERTSALVAADSVPPENVQRIRREITDLSEVFSVMESFVDAFQFYAVKDRRAGESPSGQE